MSDHVVDYGRADIQTKEPIIRHIPDVERTLLYHNKSEKKPKKKYVELLGCVFLCLLFHFSSTENVTRVTCNRKSHVLVSRFIVSYRGE